MDVTNIISKLRLEREAIDRVILFVQSEGKRHRRRPPLHGTVVPITGTVGGAATAGRSVTTIRGDREPHDDL